MTTSTIDLEKKAELHAEQQRNADIRFKQTLFGGVGAAMIFGLVSAICTKLVPLAIGAIQSGGLFTAAALGPIGGLVAVGAVGLGCIYFGSQLLSKVIMLEQESQARRIQEAKSRSTVPTLEPEVNKGNGTVPGFTNVTPDAADLPSATVEASSIVKGTRAAPEPHTQAAAVGM